MPPLQVPCVRPRMAGPDGKPEEVPELQKPILGDTRTRYAETSHPEAHERLESKNANYSEVIMSHKVDYVN